MPGTRITDQQVKKYMTHRKRNSQVVAAAKAGISERSARRIDKQQQDKKPAQRQWRTREDPLESIWDSIVVPKLQADAEITAVGIFDYLCEHHTDKFKPSSRRTLERRIRKWRSLHGASKDVVFIQTHDYGVLGIADFTHVKSPVTIAGERLKHMLFHYRMPASGWAYAQVIYGGESFAAFSDGLQNAFRAAGGVPQEIRTDSLSAAYRNHSDADDLTERFNELVKHYGFRPSRNNRGVAHENGAIEGPHGHAKSQVEQALKIRGSHDFKSREAYETFVDHVIARRNRRINDKFVLEQRQLQALPRTMSVNYTEHYVTVSRTSTIALKRVTYSVPSRLVGSRLLVRLYDSRLELFYGTDFVLELERVYAAKGARARSVNYQHLIDALAKKPRAFRNSQLRDDLLPDDNYKAIWKYVDEALPADKASYYMVKVLHLAKQSGCERQLGRYIVASITQRQLPAIRECEERFLVIEPRTPNLTVKQHSLSSYSSMIPGGLNG
ncbi:transposase [Idiomarina fontislapidosi]|uniref:IS21 family transposase n=1 Tax=Idiomarina fontislapidosi TaxID=263723 RepID=A0A432XDK7_9GAMM|nr:IS21 family transposase [Idiomarina fontislapidosi]PYE29958.1 transposase [Idiomarina fontislapidosi]RUO46785.1 IS21 family transposase [Idiomarina fontislapidosi]